LICWDRGRLARNEREARKTVQKYFRTTGLMLRGRARRPRSQQITLV